MTCAGLSGHIHVVDGLIEGSSSPPALGAAFVGALSGLQKDIVDYVVRAADRDGLDKCLLMSAARIWSCSTLEDVEFLLYAIQSLTNAGAVSFQKALQLSCGDAVIEHWNGLIFMEKASILQRLVDLGISHLTPDFFGRILLMTCVTFLFKLLQSQKKVSRSQLESTKLHLKSGEDLRCEAIVQDMINLLSVLCKNEGANVFSSQLLNVTFGRLEDVGRLLHVSNLPMENNYAEWPLRMIKFLLTDCGIKDLSDTVTTLAAFQAARLNILLPVVQLFIELQCFEAVYVYLDLSITFCQMDAIRYLLGVVSQPVDTARLIQAVRLAASNRRGPPRGPQGVLCALHSNFLRDKDYTLTEAVMLAELPETDPSVKMALKTEWSPKAFEAGVQAGENHFLSFMLVKKHARSPLRVGELPLDLQAAIGYLPLYKDCWNTPGSLLSQRQRGELIAALRRIDHGGGSLSESELLNAEKPMLLSRLAAFLPAWCSATAFQSCCSS
ncbi:ankyrin repeat protein SKIP35 [Physcomitrium patens]|uniref:Uncharacterized protein n=1 Tax=Physcomitrium patens TaxID=3218 RepID=A0A2K1JGS3_PHYPA|nr:ankyrin repeat protein SKIP35-like [Physcomitrium patens]XP_024393812.1 ankyrin repeat protein SKIP35-like [Physcomitrium patens]XP_024393813.1 ankyrin repeat protein SKIP35-like [Physcomitrium patens]XP_024393814.1 ankyrin repeat protein SKIP35-like [Physcomitrium patens]XP_024393815.1 ankyrin repeat protein SKIP35-like [Physcomitrium patens]XP_024393816.1 ankyrin repeat protein SKIP35-like [Physcomitrium patens]XP_024393817.1 ankyrin repeat protein SKIP35-like [Physcomitrium patens]PNR4|eukprot:XP_024393810.1 ankyrin repeat protein SKIP35-like [Physcomitrella patens]